MAQFYGSSELNIDGTDLADEIAEILGDKIVLSDIQEITIYFDYEGYYTAGRTYGPPEDCYPADFEEERFITSFVIGDKDFDKSNEHFKTLCDLLNLQIIVDEHDIDYGEEY